MDAISLPLDLPFVPEVTIMHRELGNRLVWPQEVAERACETWIPVRFNCGFHADSNAAGFRRRV
jgi:hypothetical protein